MIVEDHAIFREGLKTLLKDMEECEVVGEAENGQVFLDLLPSRKPDIVLMDLRMPVMDGSTATEKALSIRPDLKIIIITMFNEEEYVLSMINKGVSGYLLKTARAPEIERAIRTVATGQQYFSPELNSILIKKIRQVDSPEKLKFSTREIEILTLLSQGVSTADIAEKLYLSKRTVEGYKARLLEKTEQTNTVNLVIYAIKNKLVNL